MAIQRYGIQPVFTVHFLGTVAHQLDNICRWIRTLSRASINWFVLMCKLFAGKTL